MKLYIILLLLSSFSFSQNSLKSKKEFHSIEIFEKIIKEFNIDSKRKYMEVYEDSKELGLPPLSKLSQIYPEWEGWNEPSPKKNSSDWVKKELRKIQEDVNEVGGSEEEEELEEKNNPTLIKRKRRGKIVQKKNLVPYEELKKIARNQEVKTRRYYLIWREKNKGVIDGRRIPSNPDAYYDEWKGWNEFLGKKPAPPFAPYEELKKILIAQGIKKSREYFSWREKNKGVFNGWRIPSNPHISYGEWEGWGVFLGKKSSPPPPFVPYKELKKILKDQGVKSIRDYHLLREKNKGVINGWSMPSNPDRYYEKEWVNWNEFFGKKPSLPFAPYKELKKISRDQGIKSAKDYQLFREKNKGVFNGQRLPSNPDRYYKKEWVSWNEFLGKCETAFKKVSRR